MGSRQTNFLNEFKESFKDHLGETSLWDGGQVIGNTASLISHSADRRPAGAKKTERFELGDTTTNYRGWKIIIEFENKELPLSNILKYWPYLRGELSTLPNHPILLCHFSDWWSYATRRDLWEWTLSRMQNDPDRIVNIRGRQFDHWGDDSNLRLNSISTAIQWIDDVINLGK